MNKLLQANVYYRAAAGIITTATKGGPYPNYTFSGWTRLVGKVLLSGNFGGMEADGQDELADGTQLTQGEKSVASLEVTDFSAADAGTIRTAFLNHKVDVLVVDPDQPALGMGLFGVRLYPKRENPIGGAPKITIAGERKFGAAVAAIPVTDITIS